MATYTDLYNLFSDAELRNKITVAVIVATETVRNEAPATANHANRLLWAKEALTNPSAMGSNMYLAVLAQNKSSTVAQIQNATDAVIQTNVENVIDIFATG